MEGWRRSEASTACFTRPSERRMVKVAAAASCASIVPPLYCPLERITSMGIPTTYVAITVARAWAAGYMCGGA